MAFTTVPAVVDGDDLTDDFTLAVKAATDQLSARHPKTFSAAGTAVSGTFATETVVCSLVIPAQTAPSFVTVQGFLRLVKTVVGDSFTVNLYANGGVLNQHTPINEQGTYGLAFNGRFAISAGAALTFQLAVLRTAGAGSASTQALYHFNHIDALWIPDAP